MMRKKERTVRSILLLLGAFFWLVVRICAQEDNQSHILENNQITERELAGGQYHSYQIALAPKDFVHVVLEQLGIDLVIALFSPDGRRLIEVNGWQDVSGQEQLSWIAEIVGNYRLEVRPSNKKAKVGKYKIKITELRPASDNDIVRLSAQRAFIAGDKWYKQGDPESMPKALERYKEALGLYQKAGDQVMEALALTKLGLIYRYLGETENVLRSFEQAIVVRRSLNDKIGEAYALIGMADGYIMKSESGSALALYKKALALFQASGHQSGMGLALLDIGQANSSSPQVALDYFNQALPFSRTAGDRIIEALLLKNIGEAYYSLGYAQKAIDAFYQALNIFQAQGDLNNVYLTLNPIARCYHLLGKNQEALENASAALSLARDFGNRLFEGYSLLSIGISYQGLGETQKALASYQDALIISRSLGNRQMESALLDAIGGIYQDLGEEQKSLDFRTQSLALSKIAGDQKGEAVTLLNLSNVAQALGESIKATSYLLEAYTIFHEIGDQRNEAITLSQMGQIAFSSGNKQRAIDLLNKAIELHRSVGDKQWEALSLRTLGMVYRSLSDWEKALNSYMNALSLSRATTDSQNEAELLYRIADVEGDLSNPNGNLMEAQANIEAALSIIESGRTKIANDAFRSSYFAKKQYYYQLCANILIRLHKQHPTDGYDAAALQISERGRSRSLVDLLTEAGADIRQGVDLDLLKRERSIQQLLNAKADLQIKLLSGPHTEAQVATVKKELEDLTSQYQEAEGMIRSKSPQYAALTQPQLLSIKETQQQLLDSDTLLLEYSLGTDKSYVWAVTQSSIKSYELPPGAEIETIARRFYDLLSAPKDLKSRNMTEAGAALSQILLSPIASILDKKRLLIVADGALHYLPFAALPEPSVKDKPNESRPLLVVGHEIVNLPSISPLAILRRGTSGRTIPKHIVAVVADPVFDKDDERVKLTDISKMPGAQISAAMEERGIKKAKKAAIESGMLDAELRIQRLPGTRKEAEKITSLVPAGESMLALDFEANRATVTRDNFRQYRIIHLATHGFIDSVHPELSGIVLSLVDEQGKPQDGYLRAHEIFNLNLPVELVVLSACQTGLGKEIRGEGLIGLTRAFMYAGAPRLVVSLWDVDDDATSELMFRFYKIMFEQKMPPAAALRVAQVEMLGLKRWEAPYYWAAFTLQGEWR